MPSESRNCQNDCDKYEEFGEDFTIFGQVAVCHFIFKPLCCTRPLWVRRAIQVYKEKIEWNQNIIRSRPLRFVLWVDGRFEVGESLICKFLNDCDTGADFSDFLNN